MVGSSTAEAAVVEATGQRKQSGHKRERTRADMDKHNARCVKYRKNKKTRFEELENLEKEVVPKLQAENQMMKMEREEFISKIERQENEMRALKEQVLLVANWKEMIREIPTSWEFGGQKFSSIEDCQAWILSQNYDQPVCQGSDYSNTTASFAGPSFAANPYLATLLDAPNNPLFSHYLAAGDITGTLTNPVAGSSFGANDGLSVNDDNIVLLTQNPTAGTLSNSGGGSSFGANQGMPVFGADNTGLSTYDPANGFVF